MSQPVRAWAPRMLEITDLCFFITLFTLMIDSSDVDDDHERDKDHRRRRAPKKEADKTRRHRRSRSPSSSGDSDGASKYVTGNRRGHIRPRTYDGTTSFETFWAHFECCSEYNRWRSSDKLAHLKAALVGDAGQVLWLSLIHI